MIECVWAVLCSKSIIDDDTKNISLISVLEQCKIELVGPIPTAKNPLHVPEAFELVTLWTRDDTNNPCKGRSRITIIPPDGAPAVTGPEFVIDLTVHERLRMRTHVGGFPVTGSGRYKFHVEHYQESDNEWKKVVAIPLFVQLVETKDVG